VTLAPGKSKVFISWSGNLSKQVAVVWHDLLSHLFDAVVPFMSEADIGAGERGLARIETELADTLFGIIVVTQENQRSQWLNFEAGALSKNLPDAENRVAPCLVDFPLKSDATGPLTQFQATLLDREGIERILVAIADVMHLNTESLRQRFVFAWDAVYKDRFAKASETPAGTPEHRPEREILDEILTIARDLPRNNGNSVNDERRLSLPLDIPLEEIREILRSFPKMAELPARLAATDDGKPLVVIDLDDDMDAMRTEGEPLMEALIKIGAGASLRFGYRKGV
jgi:hypothetical protein